MVLKISWARLLFRKSVYFWYIVLVLDKLFFSTATTKVYFMFLKMLFISLHIFYYCSDAERVSELEVIPNTLIYHSLCNDLAASRSGFWSNGPQHHRIRRASSDTCCFHIQGTTGNDILLKRKSNIYPLIAFSISETQPVSANGSREFYYPAVHWTGLPFH